MRARIAEIFYSIQLEGTRIGYPSIFVRFSGCNLKCDFCDTEYALGSGVSMDIHEVGDAVSHFGCRRIIFTGGEPVLFDGFMAGFFLEYPGFDCSLETNGTMFPEESVGFFSHIVVSPKLFALNREILCRFSRLPSVEFKFVVRDCRDVARYMSVADELGIGGCVMQPMWIKGDTVENYVKRATLVMDCVKHLYGDRNVRVIIQNQKVIYGDRRGV